MKTKSLISHSARPHFPVILIAGIFCLAANAASAADPAGTAAKLFDIPEQAAASLVEAAASFKVPDLKAILGPDSEDLVASEDPAMDKQRAQQFAAEANEKQTIEIDPANPDRAILSIGEDAFPLPIPIVKKDGKWSFDTKSGREEILNRRIGANELDAITICRGYVEAQHEYAATKHDGAIVNQYAQRVISTSGKQDGLA